MSGPFEPQRPGGVPGPEEVARAYWGVALVGKQRGASVSAYAPGATCQLPGEPSPRDAQGMADWFTELYDAFPDLVFELVDLVAQADRVAVRWRAWGTFTGPGRMAGLVPNGRRLDLAGVDYAWVADGLIAKVVSYYDTGAVARQLGALPPAGSVPERAALAATNARSRVGAALRRRRRPAPDGTGQDH
jgi:predicted ester cyclase